MLQAPVFTMSANFKCGNEIYMAWQNHLGTCQATPDYVKSSDKIYNKSIAFMQSIITSKLTQNKLANNISLLLRTMFKGSKPDCKFIYTHNSTAHIRQCYPKAKCN